MMTPAAPESTPYQPNAAQSERVEALRRFNWLYIYTPIILVSLAVLTLVGLLLWGALAPDISGTREFASALADIVVIVATIPMMLLCAIGPGLAIAYGVYKRKQPDRPHGRLHTLMWRVDALVANVQDKTGRAMPRLAGPVIAGHAWAAYLRTWWHHLKQIISRS